MSTQSGDQMEGFSSPYDSHHYSDDNGSPSTAPTTDINLAAHNPKRRAGRKKFKETRHPVYRGIRQRSSGKWVCEVREPVNKARIWLGTFPTADMAARAHDVAAIAFRGRSTCLNFADSASLPVPDSGDIKDIQRAAAEAAAAFKPTEEAVERVAASVNVEAEEGRSSGGVDFSYMDEEDMFGMPENLAHMYNGMMLPQPSSTYVADDYVEHDVDYQLWNF